MPKATQRCVANLGFKTIYPSPKLLNNVIVNVVVMLCFSPVYNTVKQIYQDLNQFKSHWFIYVYNYILLFFHPWKSLYTFFHVYKRQLQPGLRRLDSSAVRRSQTIRVNFFFATTMRLQLASWLLQLSAEVESPKVSQIKALLTSRDVAQIDVVLRHSNSSAEV